jgi:predicted P-loop ATPase
MLLWELSELGATTRRNDLEALKSFFTMEIFDLRLPWGKRGERFPHRASYIATVNDGAPFLNDPTGNRRYMVLNMESIDWNYTSVDVNQLWAEAVYLYNNDFDWRLTAEEASVRDEQNELHNTPNIMDDYIAKYCLTDLPGHHFTPSSELTEAFIALPLCKGKTERQLQIDIATAMNKLGVKKRKGRITVEVNDKETKTIQVQGYLGVKINTQALNAALNAAYIREQELRD